MKYIKNSGTSDGDLKRGFCQDKYLKNEQDEYDTMYGIESDKPTDDREMDETPPNSRYRDVDDGGFAGRPKGDAR